MQQVRVYSDIFAAERDMKAWIKDGWRVHTCTMTSERPSYVTYYHILVVYEKEK
jgi:hypothetical protein